MPETTTAYAPGRINLIGEHLDYNGGRCLPVAIPYGTTASVAEASRWRFHSGTDSWEGPLGEPGSPEQVTGWAAYVAGVMWALGVTTPLEVAISSTLPIGAGLSSSAALVCSVALAVDDRLGLRLTREDLRDACIRAETEYVGSPTGGLDQTAVLFAGAAQALLIDFTTGGREPVRFDPDADGLGLLIVDTGVSHRNLTDGYGDRRSECEHAAELLGVDRLVEAEEAAAAGLSDVLRRRVRHVLTEQRRVGAFVAAVAESDWIGAGSLMNASHASLRDDFEVSCPELDLVVEAAVGAGAYGARMTGGGFGGSAIVLAPVGHLPRIRQHVSDRFIAAALPPPPFLDATPSPAAHLLP